MSRQRGLYILDPNSFGLIYGPDEQRDIAAQVEIMAPPLSAREALARPELLAEADVIFSGWKGPMLDEAFFAAAPKLKAVFYGAGSMGYILTPAVWERGIVVTSALEANAVPVAEYALATILFSLKHGWRLAQDDQGGSLSPGPKSRSRLLRQHGGIGLARGDRPEVAGAAAAIRFERARVRPVPRRT